MSNGVTTSLGTFLKLVEKKLRKLKIQVPE
jgi:hypothetical protein